jgi:hypothetical protein
LVGLLCLPIIIDKIAYHIIFVIISIRRNIFLSGMDRQSLKLDLNGIQLISEVGIACLEAKRRRKRKRGSLDLSGWRE